MNRFTKNSLVLAFIACVFLGSANLASAKGGHGGGHRSSHKSGSHTHKTSHKTTAKKTTKKTNQKTTKKNNNKQAKRHHRHHRHHSGYRSYDYMPVYGAADGDDDDASEEVAMVPAYEISE